MKPLYSEMPTAKLEARAAQAVSLLESCRICPRACEVDRTAGELGDCGVGSRAVVSSYGPHFGEERPLRGKKGSGTIFFSGCNLHCQYCQNASISQQVKGEAVDRAALAGIMLDLQNRGCHNINFVSPTHVLPQIIAAVSEAAGKGLRIPLVYNSGGYDCVSTLKLLDGIMDIYMPDMKYAHPESGRKYSRAADYPAHNQQAVLEMHRQVGDLVLSDEGIAERGLLIRHLLLPGEIAGTVDILEFIVDQISPDTYVNLMDQYRPAYLASRYPVLQKRISRTRYQEMKEKARALGLWRLDQG